MADKFAPGSWVMCDGTIWVVLFTWPPSANLTAGKPVCTLQKPYNRQRHMADEDLLDWAVPYLLIEEVKRGREVRAGRDGDGRRDWPMDHHDGLAGGSQPEDEQNGVLAPESGRLREAPGG